MILKYDGRVARLFRFCHGTSQAFVGRSPFLQPEYTNVCSLVRTIVLWTPLAILINLLAIGSAVYSTSLFIYVLAVNYSVTGIALLFIVTAIIFVGLCFLLFGGLRRLTETTSQAEATQVAISWYKAHKEQICPLITIVRK